MPSALFPEPVLLWHAVLRRTPSPAPPGGQGLPFGCPRQSAAGAVVHAELRVPVGAAHGGDGHGALGRQGQREPLVLGRVADALGTGRLGPTKITATHRGCQGFPFSPASPVVSGPPWVAGELAAADGRLQRVSRWGHPPPTNLSTRDTGCPRAWETRNTAKAVVESSLIMHFQFWGKCNIFFHQIFSNHVVARKPCACESGGAVWVNFKWKDVSSPLINGKE